MTDWSGTVGVGIASSNVEYFDEPALAVMLCALPSDQYRVFSGGAAAFTFTPHTALVHADVRTPDVAELIAEMADRTATGYLFGGLASSRGDVVQFAVGGNGNLQGHGKAGGVFRGGLSGVAFAEGVQLVSRVTQGCRPIAPARTITGADGNLVTELDGDPALDVLLEDLHVTLEQPEAAMAALRATLVGLTQASQDVTDRAGHFGTDVVVRHLIGLDPRRRGVAIADKVEEDEARVLPAQCRSRARTWCASVRRSARNWSRRNCRWRWPVRSPCRMRWRPLRPRARSPARSTSAAPAAAVPISAGPVRSCRSCAAPWATPWWASSPAARSPQSLVRLHRRAHGLPLTPQLREGGELPAAHRQHHV